MAPATGTTMRSLALAMVLLLVLADRAQSAKLRGVVGKKEARGLEANGADVGCTKVNGAPVQPCEVAPPAAALGGDEEDEDEKKNEEKSVEEVEVEEADLDEDQDEDEDEDEDGNLPLINNAAAMPTEAAAPVLSNIVNVAQGTAELSSLVALVATAGLVNTLMSPGPFTVFAPVNSALPEGTDLLEFQSNTPTDTLVSILTYHVVPGRVMSTDLFDGMEATTAQGSNVTISIAMSNSTVMVNDATVIAADIEASNGVVHLIDTLLIPPSDVAVSRDSAP